MRADMGESLKRARKKVGLTQKVAAEGICSQSMLSAIEKGKYVPSSTILLALSRRLNIALDEFSLAQNYVIGESDRINARMVQLCNNHEYRALLRFLETVTVLDSIATQKQTQAYYYYLGVARFQTQTSHVQAVQALEMSLASAPSGRHGDTLSRLAIIALGIIEAQQGHGDEAHAAIEKAVRGLQGSLVPQDSPTPAVAYDENQNIVLYLAALIYFELGENSAAAERVASAVSFITSHRSHYMLANCYALLARIAQASARDDEALEAQQRSDFLVSLFGEVVFADFA